MTRKSFNGKVNVHTSKLPSKLNVNIIACVWPAEASVARKTTSRKSLRSRQTLTKIERSSGKRNKRNVTSELLVLDC